MIKSKNLIISEISKSEATYLRNSLGIIEKKNGKLQNSYNLKKQAFKELEDTGIMVADSSFLYKRKIMDGYIYVVNKEYTFRLGYSILWIIGEIYRDRENKFIASLNPNGKYQMYRTVYSDLSENDKDYEWFVALYDKNIPNTSLILNLDFENKTLVLEIGLK